MNTEIDPRNLRGNGERILVVDDEPNILEMLSELFSSNGFTVSLAWNAEKALELFKEENGNFDLVFTDICLPGMNGLELAEKLTVKKPGLPILLGSGALQDESQLETIVEKGYPFISKPYRFTPLLKTVKQLRSV
jgi:DNA-binding NtrC family response regulator